MNFFVPALMPGEPGYRHAAGDGDSTCVSESSQYSCTLEAGHEPPHMAHGTSAQIVALWYDFDENEKPEVIA